MERCIYSLDFFPCQKEEEKKGVTWMSCTTTSHTLYYDPVRKRKKTKTLAILPNGALIQPSSALLPSIHLQNKIKKLTALFLFFLFPFSLALKWPSKARKKQRLQTRKWLTVIVPGATRLEGMNRRVFVTIHTHTVHWQNSTCLNT